MEFNGYPLFDDILDPTLRTWNRLNTLFNIKGFVGNDVASAYAQQLDRNGKIALLIMANHVTINGYEITRREIFKDRRIIAA